MAAIYQFHFHNVGQGLFSTGQIKEEVPMAGVEKIIQKMKTQPNGIRFNEAAKSIILLP